MYLTLNSLYKVAHLVASVKPKWKFCPSAEAEPSVVKITEYSAEDEASAEDRSFC